MRYTNVQVGLDFVAVRLTNFGLDYACHLHNVPSCHTALVSTSPSASESPMQRVQDQMELRL